MNKGRPYNLLFFLKKRKICTCGMYLRLDIVSVSSYTLSSSFNVLLPKILLLHFNNAFDVPLLLFLFYFIVITVRKLPIIDNWPPLFMEASRVPVFVYRIPWFCLCCRWLYVKAMCAGWLSNLWLSVISASPLPLKPSHILPALRSHFSCSLIVVCVWSFMFVSVFWRVTFLRCRVAARRF